MWKYVMVGFEHDYFDHCFIEMKEKMDCLFLDSTVGNGPLSKLQKLCVSEITNKYINIPFKEIWMNDFSKWLKDYNGNICFVFSKGHSWLLEYKNGKYIELLRRKYQDCKIVMYSCDLISTYHNFDIDFFRKRCDKVLTYDKEDASRYGLIYAPLPYGKTEIIDNPDIKPFDVFFCGKAKNRLQEIHGAYEYFSRQGLKCLFFITDVDKSECNKEGIIYNKRISYEKYLQYVMKCDAILEIAQKGSNGDTLRTKEALVYGKLLITDNCDLKTRDYFNPNQVYIYNEKEGVDMDCFRQNQKNKFESVHFDKFYDALFNI